jgi:hypothetical protein
LFIDFFLRVSHGYFFLLNIFFIPPPIFFNPLPKDSIVIFTLNHTPSLLEAFMPESGLSDELVYPAVILASPFGLVSVGPMLIMFSLPSPPPVIPRVLSVHFGFSS